MTLEEFNQRFGDLSEDQRQATAKALKVKLPFVAVPVAEQLKATKIGTHKTKAGKEREYVMAPNIQISEEESLRGFWVNKANAKEIVSYLSEFIEKNGL